MDTEIVIPARFCGPRSSANGGYACGAIAGAVGEPAEVTLRNPPPLDTPLEITAEPEGAFTVRDGETLVAQARRVEPFELEIPDPPSLEEASAASAPADPHPLPHCFVCGPLRESPDGMRIFPAPVPGKDLVAAPWRPDASVVDEHGQVPPEIVWAVLDCPSGIPFWALRGWTGAGVLGRMAARRLVPCRVGESYVVIGWASEIDGRKGHGGSAIFSEGGELHAYARTTWISLS